MNTETTSQPTQATRGAFTWCPFVFLLFPFIAAMRTITLPEYWVHVALGKAGIARQETFSWAFSGTKYVNVHAGYDILLAALHDMGAGPVILVHALAVVAGFALLALASKRYGSGLATVWAILLATGLMLPKMEPSPILLALPFMGALFFGLERLTKPAALWGVVAVSQLFWTQIHPSFLLGPVLCCLYAYQAGQSASAEGPEAKTYWIAAGIALGVSLLNPYGPGLHVWIFSHLHDPFLQTGVTGISAISDQVGADWFKRMLYIAMVVSGLGLLTYKDKLPFAITASLVLVGLLTVLSIGRLSYHLLAVMGFPFMVLSASSMGAFINAQLGDKQSLSALGGLAGAGIVALFCLYSLGSGGFYQSIGSASRLGIGIDHTTTSIETAKWMSGHDLPETLVHLPVDGGVLRATRPDRQIFIDQRLGAFSRPTFVDVNKALLSGSLESWREFDDLHRPELVLLNLTIRGSQNTARLLLNEPNWKLLRFDGTSALLIRTSAEQAQKLLADKPAQAQGLESLQSAKENLTLSLSSSGAPQSPLQVLGGAHFYSALNRWPQANALLELSAAAIPSLPEAWVQLGVSRFQIGEFDRSIQALQKATALSPDDVVTWAWLARAYQSDGRPAEAQNALGRAKAINPELTEQLKAAWQLKG